MIQNKLKKLVKYITHPSKIYIYITYRIVRIIDGFHDRRICGYDLTKRRVTNIEGGNHYAPTCYWTLDEMFRNTKFTEKDHIVDVGCGKGRVLVWWLGKGLPGKATGIELDPYVAGVARMWLQRYPEERVRLIEGDAMEQDYSEYTIVYLFRSFTKDFLILKDRPGWNMQFREKLTSIYGVKIAKAPQYYSIWKYDPQQNNS